MADAADSSTVLWDAAKIGIPVFLTWLITSVRAKKIAEQTVDQKSTEQLVAKAVGEIRDTLNARLTRIEFVVWGVDEKNGLRSESRKLARRLDDDHVLLLHLSMMTRELYRRVTNEEPPPPHHPPETHG